MAQAQTVTVANTGWADHGIDIVSATTPNFASIAGAALNPQSASNLTEFYPVSFVVRNRTTHAIAAYGSKWEWMNSSTVKRPRGNLHVNPSTFQGPEAIPAGGDRLVTPVLGLGYQPGPDPDALAVLKVKALSPFAAGDTVIVSLDVVVLDDGTVLGPDTYQAADRLRAVVDASRQVTSNLLKRAESAVTTNDVASYLDEIVSLSAPTRGGLSVSQAIYNQEYWLYSRTKARIYSQILQKGGLPTLLGYVDKQVAAIARIPYPHR